MKKGLALAKEKSLRGSNPRNFLSMLHVMSESNDGLRNHLHAPENINAINLSPYSQNEIIIITGNDFILKQFQYEIRAAKFDSIDHALLFEGQLNLEREDNV